MTGIDGVSNDQIFLHQMQAIEISVRSVGRVHHQLTGLLQLIVVLHSQNTLLLLQLNKFLYNLIYVPSCQLIFSIEIGNDLKTPRNANITLEREIFEIVFGIDMFLVEDWRNSLSASELCRSTFGKTKRNKNCQNIKFIR